MGRVTSLTADVLLTAPGAPSLGNNVFFNIKTGTLPNSKFIVLNFIFILLHIKILMIFLCHLSDTLQFPPLNYLIM